MTSRRELLRSAAGLGLAASVVPLCGRASPSGSVRPLALDYARVDIGLEHPFSILHISDTHLTAVYPHETARRRKTAAERSAVFGGQQEAAIRASLDWAAKNDELVVHTGDLIDFQTEANLDLVRGIFGGKVRILGTVGNHESWGERDGDPPDGSAELRVINARALSAAYPFDLEFSNAIVNGVNFVLLDDSDGTVGESQVERFSAEVKKGLPIVLCLHVPIFTDWIFRATVRHWRFRNRKFRNDRVSPFGDSKRQMEDKTTAEFIRYLKSERLLKGILAGHEHVSMSDRFSDTAMQYVVGGNYSFHATEILLF